MTTRPRASSRTARRPSRPPPRAHDGRPSCACLARCPACASTTPPRRVPACAGDPAAAAVERE
eukprot:7390822-Prymnesium_polylepis.1